MNGIEKLVELAKEYVVNEEEIRKREQDRALFQNRFPLDNLHNLDLEDYVLGMGEDNFCYWLEFKKNGFGVGGGNASKFGIYKSNNGNNDFYVVGSHTKKQELDLNAANVFYQELLRKIIKAIKYVRDNQIDKVYELDIPIWNMVLIKILSNYNPDKFLTIGATDTIKRCADYLSIKNYDIDTDNSIALNYYCKKIISEHSFFSDWQDDKIGKFVWDTFEEETSRRVSNKTKKYWLYSPGNNAEYWDEFFSKQIMAIGWDQLGDLRHFNSKKEIENSLVEVYSGPETRKNDATANFDFHSNMKIGDVVFAKKGRNKLVGYGIITSDYIYDPEREHYKHVRKVDWKSKGSWDVGHTLSLKTLTDITRYSSEETNHDTYYERLMAIILGDDNSRANTNILMNASLNTILYGPPGTGKTHALTNEYMPQFTSYENAVTRKDLIEDMIKDLSWWQVIALSLYELKRAKVSAIKSHEYVRVKSELSNSNTIDQTLWGQLQNHTIDECTLVNVAAKSSPFIFNKTKNSEWELSFEHVEEQYPELLKLSQKIQNIEEVSEKRIKRYEFVTFHQSYSYEDFIEGIKPVLDQKEISYTIEEGIFLKICNRARNDQNNKYAIFIDEINRGNISSIFGELITLLEDDKRAGSSNEIELSLPYSKKAFSIPKNLYVIGTMNTADRSVESLDTALRRRFTFVEMTPDHNKLQAEEFVCHNIDLSALLMAINGRIEKLLDKEYCIGHSYFMNIKDRNNPLRELKLIFENKILPLLQEYFYGDWGKILLILGSEFVEEISNSISFMSSEIIEDYEEFESKPIYRFTSSSNWTLESFQSIYGS